jgi:hypothetical protein
MEGSKGMRLGLAKPEALTLLVKVLRKTNLL